MRTMEEDKLAGIISLIFGFEAKLSKKSFFEQLSKPACCWIYDPALIRKRMNLFLAPNALDNFYD